MKKTKIILIALLSITLTATQQAKSESGYRIKSKPKRVKIHKGRKLQRIETSEPATLHSETYRRVSQPVRLEPIGGPIQRDEKGRTESTTEVTGEGADKVIIKYIKKYDEEDNLVRTIETITTYYENGRRAERKTIVIRYDEEGSQKSKRTTMTYFDEEGKRVSSESDTSYE